MNEIEFSTMAGTGWTISLTLRSTTGREITIPEAYSISWTYVGDSACTNIAHALTPAVQNLVTKFVHHVDFPALIRAAKP